MVPWGYSGIAIAIWVITIAHAIRTQDAALSRTSQKFWLLGLVFFAPLFIALYWLTEAWRRRRRPPEAI